ncbi:MAG: rod-binding protein [Bacillota bacterium]|jgi:flagellar protein FlgJ|nr:rod-binding protein [Bacillota bacterium]
MTINIGSNSQYFLAGQIGAEGNKEKILEAKLNNLPSSDQELMEVCKSFEAYFLEQVMKGMERTIPYEGKKSPYIEQFGDMLYQEYAKSATENQGLGMAQMLYEAMKRNEMDI